MDASSAHCAAGIEPGPTAWHAVARHKLAKLGEDVIASVSAWRPPGTMMEWDA